MQPTALGTRAGPPALGLRPTGLTLTPTTSPFWKKRPQAAFTSPGSAPVNSVMPRSSMAETAFA